MLVGVPSMGKEGLTEWNVLYTEAHTVPVLLIARICYILAKHSILDKTERKRTTCPEDIVSSLDTQECVTLCGYKASETRKDFGQREGLLL